MDIKSGTDDRRTKLIGMIMDADGDTLDKLLRAGAAPRRASRTGTIKQAAEILGSCRRTVDRYARAGKIRRISHSPRRIRYDLDDVERLAFEGIDEG